MSHKQENNRRKLQATHEAIKLADTASKNASSSTEAEGVWARHGTRAVASGRAPSSDDQVTVASVALLLGPCFYYHTGESTIACAPTPAPYLLPEAFSAMRSRLRL